MSLTDWKVRIIIIIIPVIIIIYIVLCSTLDCGSFSSIFSGNCTGKKCSFNESVTNQISPLDCFDIFTVGRHTSLKNCNLQISHSFITVYIIDQNTGAKRIDHVSTSVNPCRY